MIPSTNEVAGAMEGSLRLIRRDAAAMSSFTVSVDAFWRSFFALVLTLPAYALFVSSEWQIIREAAPATAGSFGAYAAIDFVLYVVSWGLFPLAMVPVTRLTGLGERYVGFIIAYNWSALIVIAILFPPYALFALGVLGREGTALFGLVSMGIVLWYRFVVARIALGAPGGLAAAIVAIDVTLSLGLSLLGDALRTGLQGAS